MCGIAGFWRDREADGDHEALIDAMTLALAHRGPDAKGRWLDPSQGLALGHRRLSIRDLSASGDQPMLSSDGRYVIAFNGEVYNAGDLEAGLGSFGPLHLRGTSDTEVLLETVARVGLVEALKRSVGMFALALWDRRERTLTLARDRYGEKPLYYAEVGNDVAFGSELKALRPFPALPREPSAESIELFLRYGFVPPPLSIIEGILKLAPGQAVTFRRINGRLTKDAQFFWRPDDDLYGQLRNHGRYASLEGAADAAEAVLERAVRRQLVSDVPLGAFLSGGIDSSLVVALMGRVSGAPPKTFTIGFNDQRFDEAPYARRVARYLGTDHVEEYVSNRQIFDIIPQLPQIYDEPIADSSSIPSVLISRIARAHVTVVLSGDGGDELFAGYNHYRWGRWVASVCRAVPPSLRRFVGAGVARAGLTVRNRRLVRLGESIGALPATDPLMLLNANIPDLSRLLTDVSREREWYAQPGCDLSPVERMMAFDGQGHLSGDILAKVDRASMYVGLECRVPLLDHTVAQYAWSLPMEYRGNNTQGKRVLREVLARLIPRELFERPKSGFGFPLRSWLMADLKSMAEKYLLRFPARYEVWLRREGVARLWLEHQSGVIDRQRELWTLMSLLMWMEAENL